MEEVVLGQVREIRPAGDQRVALLEPLYRLIEDTDKWVATDSLKISFPNRGYVTWMKPDDSVMEGSVWRFSYELHPNFDASDPKRDRYRINWDRPPEELQEVLYLQVSDPDEVLKYLERGLNLSFVPTRHVYIALNKDMWAGPLKLIQEQGCWKLDPQQRQTPIDRLVALPNTFLDSLSIDGKRRFIRHDAPSRFKVGELDWSPTQLVIKRLLRHAQRSTELKRAFTLTNATIKQIVDTLPDNEHDMIGQQIERARKYLSDIDRMNVDMTQFEDELLKHPAVAERIAAAVREGRKSAKAQAESEAIEQARRELEEIRAENQQVAGSVASQRTQLAELKQAAQAAEQRAAAVVEAEMRRRASAISALDEQIAERQHQLEAQLTLADAEITKRIADLTARPGEALAQIGLIRAALGHAQPTGRAAATARTGIHPPASILQRGEPQIDDQKEIAKAIRRAMRAAGADASAGMAVHSALLAGLVPLLSGPEALDVLEQYANVIAGGRALWVNVPPTLLEPADLLGRADPHSGQFAPHSSGLLDLLIFAGEPEQRDHLFLVMLDGVNRSATDTYLQPLLACYRASQCTQQRALRAAHPSAFGVGDPYAAAAHLQWPPNVLLTGILSDGIATLPLPPSLWADAFFVKLSAPKSPKTTLSKPTSHTAVSASQWAAWHLGAESDLASGQQVVHDIIEGSEAHLPTKIARSCALAYAAHREWLEDEPQAANGAARGTLIPYALATKQFEALKHGLEQMDIKLEDAEITALQQIVI
jgi:hypothetical protein